MSTENPYSTPETEFIPEQDYDELASRWTRLGGALIDGLLGGLGAVLLFAVTGYWSKVLANEITTTELVTLSFGGFAIFFVLHGYLLATRGQTIGKLLVGTRIVSIHDQRILPFWKVYGLRYLPIQIISAIPMLGGIPSIIDTLFIFGKNKRCAHDYIAGTKVVVSRGINQAADN